MDAEVGRLLCPGAKHAAQRLGWQGAGFVGGAVETRKLDPNKLPVAFMVDCNGIFLIVRVSANVDGNCERGGISIWLHVGLAGGSAPYNSKLVCFACWAADGRPSMS